MKQLPLGLNEEESIESDLYGLFDDIGCFKKSDQYIRYLNYISRFRKYSIFNTALVFAQKPTVGFFATKKHWEKEFKRTVKDDARPLIMLRPGGPIMFAYDVEDTDGDSRLPDLLGNIIHSEGEVTPLLYSNLEVSLWKCLIELKYFTDRKNMGGFIKRTGKGKGGHFLDLEINLNQAHDRVTNFTTLIHEIAHLFLGHLGTYDFAKWPSRITLSKQQREFEAESVAYVISKRLGLKSLSERYLSGYTDKNITIPRIDIRQIGKTIEWIEVMLKGRTPNIYRSDVLKKYLEDKTIATPFE